MKRHLLTCFLFLASVAKAPPLPLATVEEQLRMMQIVLQRHPGLINENLEFRRNFFHLLSQVDGVRAALGAEAAVQETFDTRVTSGTYFGTSASYDDAAVSEIRAKLRESVPMARMDRFTTIEQDLRQILSESDAPVAREARVKAYFRLVPLIYDAEGKALSQTRADLEERIAVQRPGELDATFFDRYRNHQRKILASELKDRTIAGWLDATQSSFFDRTISPALTPKTVEGQAATRGSLSVEHVPPDVAMLVRNFGKDCSLGSVPFHTLLKTSKLYLVRDSLEAASRPKGYVFVAEVTVGGKKYPYVLTVNGPSLTDLEFRAAIQMVAKDFGTTQIILPKDPMDKQKHLANTPAARVALAAGDGKDVTVEFSKGWENLSDPKFRNPVYETNFYDPKALKDARLVEVESLGVKFPDPPSTRTLKDPYSEVDKAQLLKRSTPLERAVLAGQATHGLDSKDPRIVDIQSTLGVTEVQRALGAAIARADVHTPLDLRTFEQAKKELGMDFGDLERLDLFTRSRSLGKIYRQDQERLAKEPGRTALLPDAKWKPYFDRAARALDREVTLREGDTTKIVLPQGRLLTGWANAQMAIPVPFRSSLLQDKRLFEALEERLQQKDPSDAFEVAFRLALEGKVSDGILERVIEPTNPIQLEEMLKHNSLTATAFENLIPRVTGRYFESGDRKLEIALKQQFPPRGFIERLKKLSLGADSDVSRKTLRWVVQLSEDPRNPNGNSDAAWAEERAKKLLNDVRGEVKAHAIQTLDRLGRFETLPEGTLRSLLSDLPNESPEVRGVVTDLLARAVGNGTLSDDGVETLSRLMTHQRTDVRADGEKIFSALKARLKPIETPDVKSLQDLVRISRYRFASSTVDTILRAWIRRPQTRQHLEALLGGGRLTQRELLPRAEVYLTTICDEWGKLRE